MKYKIRNNVLVIIEYDIGKIIPIITSDDKQKLLNEIYNLNDYSDNFKFKEMSVKYFSASNTIEIGLEPITARIIISFENEDIMNRFIMEQL